MYSFSKIGLVGLKLSGGAVGFLDFFGSKQVSQKSSALTEIEGNFSNELLRKALDRSMLIIEFSTDGKFFLPTRTFWGPWVMV